MADKKSILVCALLSFMFLFSCIGYSALTDTIVIEGQAKVEVPSALFIVDITPVENSSSGLDVSQVDYINHSTTVDSTLSKSSNGTAGSITYAITVYNNTDHEYAYRGLYYQSALDNYNNGYVSTSNGNRKIGVVTSFPNGRIVGAGEYLTFNVTYTLGSSSNTFPAYNSYKTLLNFQFGINVESEAAARDAVHTKFLDILNTSATYGELVDALDNKFDGKQEWTSNYIGNVDGSVTDDNMTVETLFAGQLNMVINGETVKAKVLIKHENLDGNNMTGDDYVATNSTNGGVFRGYGCEMTLYLTTDPLTQAYGWAPVYVSVFTCDRDDEGNIVGGWYQIGDTYVGEANIVGYNGESGGTGSFVTDNWVSTAHTYDVVDGYSYYLSDGRKLKDDGGTVGIINTYDANAEARLQQLLTDAKAMIDDLTYAGTGITTVEDAYYAASKYYTVDASGNPTVVSDVNLVWLLPHIRDIDHALTEAREAIDSLQ